MALPITVPFTFANATTTQNLSSLDADFATVYNAVNGIGNGTVSLSNVNVTGGNISVSAISATGTANSTTFLRGDGSWANVATGGGSGTVTSVNAASANGFSFTGGPVTTSGTLTLNVPAPGPSGNVLTSNGAAWLSSSGAYPLTSGTPVASTSGTSIDFTSIPSWVKRITVMFNGVSTNGTSAIQIQIGSGSIDATGYSAQSGNRATDTTSTTGFPIVVSTSASFLWSGITVLCLLGSNIWVESGNLDASAGGSSVNFSAGSKTLSGVLDRIRITTVNGTDTFDAGSINILYE